MYLAKICLNSTPGGPINFILGGWHYDGHIIKGGDAIEAPRHVLPPILGPMERASSDFGRQFCHSYSIDNIFLTVTGLSGYTKLICGLVECVMPVSLYSPQSFLWMVTPVLATRNES